MRWPNPRGVLLLPLLLALSTGRAGGPPPNVAPLVWAETADGAQTTFLVVLRAQADLAPAARMPPAQRGPFVVNRLQETAQRTQVDLRRLLDRRGVPYRPFYLVNALVVTGDRALLTELSARPEVARVVANPVVPADLPPPVLTALTACPATVEWNVQQVNADDVWALGYTGQGVVVAGQDTGYDWDHPALIGAYRGWNGVTVTHDYNWHDAIHSGGGVCGADSPAPCDDHGHGTHTMGTVVGDDGSHHIGVAPGAQWIGCRNMDRGAGTPATYIECFEFFLAPYPVGGTPAQGDPSRAPQVINNSWACPPSEGCPSDLLQQAVENVRAAGILVVASAGNSGSSCSTVSDPPALYGAAFTVGATTASDAIASFSSRGPVIADGSGRRKPDISAPGVGVCSSLPGGAYGLMSGTSMAAPHVTGVAALLWSAFPDLRGEVMATEQWLEQTARPRTTSQGCGGDGPQQVPNNVYGWGIVDALAAVEVEQASLAVGKEALLLPGIPARQLLYTITVTNTGPSLLSGVVITDAVPAGASPLWASGVYTAADGVVTWAPASLGPGSHLTATLVVDVAAVPRGAWVVNERYGARVEGEGIVVTGPVVQTFVPWRVILPVLERGDH